MSIFPETLENFLNVILNDPIVFDQIDHNLFNHSHNAERATSFQFFIIINYVWGNIYALIFVVMIIPLR